MDLKALEIRASELRTEINELATADDADAAQLDKLRNEYGTVEARMRALKTISESQPTPTNDDRETREFGELESRASVGSIIDATIAGRLTDGAEAELQTELGLNANQIPLALIETRAATPAPSDVGRNQAPILDAVFPNGAAAFLGVSQPTVAAGESVYPVMTTATAASDYDEAASVDDTVGAFETTVLKPRRIQASFSYSREDRALFAGMEDALRRNLSDSLSAGLDKYVLIKADTGLFDHGTDPADASSETTYAGYRAAIMGRVDGIYASRASDVKLLVNAATYQHMDTEFRNNNGSDESALEAVMRLSGGVRVSGHAPAAASKVSDAVTFRGPGGAAVAPIWNGVTIIDDQITGAATGTLKLTAVMLGNFAVLRADQYVRLSFKSA